MSSSTTAGNPRNKVALKPGRSLMDWIRLTNASDLSGTGGKMRDVTLEELGKHNTKTDAWLAIRGKVYNVTSYFEFHPGGEDELIRGVGIDATELFDQVHKWVNYESMLKKCLVGRLKNEPFPPKRENAFTAPRLPPPSPSIAVGVTTDWMQSPSQVTVVFYTRQKGLDARRISTALEERLLRVRIHSDDFRRCFDYSVQLTGPVEHETRCLVVSPSTGKVELSLRKQRPDAQWPSLGDVKTGGSFRTLSQTQPFFRRAILSSRTRVNHNVYLFAVTFPPGHEFHVPVGWHVQLKLVQEDGSEIIRNFTPVPVDISGRTTTDCPSKVGSTTTLHFLIKIYPSGPFTARLDKLAEGATIEVSDPIGTFDDSKLKDKDIVAIAAGTGITPMIRPVINALLNDRHVSLLFFNRGSSDIIWAEEFRILKENYPEALRVWHVLSEPEDDWTGLRGRVSPSILASTIDSTIRDLSNFICVCGPSDFTLETLRLLNDAGYKGEAVHAFSG